MNTFLLLILTTFVSASVQAQEKYDFSTITAAFATFLNTDFAKIAGDQDDQLKDFYYLTSYATRSLLKNPNHNYTIIHTCDFDYYGKAIPVVYQPFVINNSGDTVDIIASGYYFVTHTDPKTKIKTNLIIRPSRDEVAIYALTNTYTSTEMFIERFRKFEVDLNPYKAAVIEIDDYPSWPQRSVFKFMSNLQNIESHWDDLILDPALKALSYDQTEGFLARDALYKEYGYNMKKGVLLAGPPGTGKSMLAEVLIHSILKGELKGKSTFVVVSARHLEQVSRTKILYSGARRLSPTAIFMEDIDLLGVKNRENNQGDYQAESRLNELLNGIDGLVDANHTLTIGTTNRMDYVDPALTRSMRLGQHIYYGLPAFQERLEFFNRFGRKKAVWADDVTDIWLAGLTERMSGADIIEIIRLAKRDAYLNNSWQGENLFLLPSHFLNAIELLKKEHETNLEFMSLKNIYGLKNRDYNMSLKKLKFFENRWH